MTAQAHTVIIWTILGVSVPAAIAALTMSFYAGGWKASDVAQAEAFVQFRQETREELGKIRTDVADIRAVVCATNRDKCRIKSAADDLDDTRRASAQ
jgi:hypothetical protein